MGSDVLEREEERKRDTRWGLDAVKISTQGTYLDSVER